MHPVYTRANTSTSLVSQEFTLGRFELQVHIFNQILAHEKVFTPYLQMVRAFGCKLQDNQAMKAPIDRAVSEKVFADNSRVSYSMETKSMLLDKVDVANV